MIIETVYFVFITITEKTSTFSDNDEYSIWTSALLVTREF